VVAPSASAPSPPRAAEEPTGAILDDIEGEYHRRCDPFAGDPRSWSTQPPSDEDYDEMMRHHSFCGWVVSAEDGQLQATAHARANTTAKTLPFQPKFQPCHEVLRCGEREPALEGDPPQRVSDYLRTDHGYLVAYDSGEWGGGLYWFSPEGDLLGTLSEENTHRLISTPSGILVFEGVAHLVIDRGRVLRLTWANKAWKVEARKLPGAPRAVAPQPDGSVLTIAHEMLLRIAPTLQVTLIHNSDWWWANSVVQMPDGSFYIGMDFAVSHLTPTATGFTEQWLEPPGARTAPPPASDSAN
jgi:hypothetical protein